MAASCPSNSFNVIAPVFMLTWMLSLAFSSLQPGDFSKAPIVNCCFVPDAPETSMHLQRDSLPAFSACHLESLKFAAYADEYSDVLKMPNVCLHLTETCAAQIKAVSGHPRVQCWLQGQESVTHVCSRSSEVLKILSTVHSRTGKTIRDCLGSVSGSSSRPGPRAAAGSC